MSNHPARPALPDLYAHRRRYPRPVPYDADAISERIVETKARNPRTLDEWQYAADAAEFFLGLDACHQYGLITGGPGINVARCETILRRAEARGITPRAVTDTIPVFLPALVAGESA